MRKAFIVLASIWLLLAGLMASAQEQQPSIISHLNKEDLLMLTEDATPAQLQDFAANKNSRKVVLRELSELLAKAVEAQRRGLASSPEVIAQLEFMRALTISQVYGARERRGQAGPAFDGIKAEEVEAVANLAETTEKFERFVKIAQAGNILPAGDIPTADKARLKDDWIKILLTVKKAEKEGFDQLRRTQVQVSLQQATHLSQILDRQYLNAAVRPSEVELTSYLGKHPEYTIAPLRARAEDLLRRIRAGEDFASLAKQYTDDPGSKENGGFYDWFGRGRMVKEFENGAFGLRVGNVSGIVETQYGFHIIKSVGRRNHLNRETGKLEEQVQVRHILVSTMAPPDPANPLAPQLSLRDKARAEIEKEKRTRILDALILSTGVTVPTDWL